MKTLDVRFNGKAYKIRNNQLTRRFWAEEVAASPKMTNLEMVVKYGYCLLKGFNLSFNMSYLEYEMYLDDEENTDFIKGITELVGDLLEEMNKNAKENEGESTEKK
jgi:hypothetical protein